MGFQESRELSSIQGRAEVTPVNRAGGKGQREDRWWLRKWEWGEAQAVWEKRPSYSVEVDRKSSVRRTPAGKLIPVTSLPLPSMDCESVQVFAWIEKFQHSVFYSVFLKSKLFILGRQVSQQHKEQDTFPGFMCLIPKGSNSPPRLEDPRGCHGDTAHTGVSLIPSLSFQPCLQIFSYSQFPAQLSEIGVNVCGN